MGDVDDCRSVAAVVPLLLVLALLPVRPIWLLLGRVCVAAMRPTTVGAAGNGFDVEAAAADVVAASAMGRDGGTGLVSAARRGLSGRAEVSVRLLLPVLDVDELDGGRGRIAPGAMAVCAVMGWVWEAGRGAARMAP